MSRAKKPLTDDALAAMVAERIAELEAVIKVHEAGIVAAKAALAKLRPSEGMLVPGQLLGSLSVNFTEDLPPKRVVVGAHKAVRVEEQNAPRPSKRDESTCGEPSPEAGPQAEASPVGTDTGTPAGHEGRTEGEGASVESLTLPAPADLTIPPFLDRSNPACAANRGR